MHSTQYPNLQSRIPKLTTGINLLVLSVVGLCCDGEADTANASSTRLCNAELPFATEIISFNPGESAGFGQSELPDIVLGPPEEGPPSRGSFDVLSLGVQGEITLGFGDAFIVDNPGPDFIVWENAFWIAGNSASVFAELAQVSVSLDGDTWIEFPCNPNVITDSNDVDSPSTFDPGCAGFRPRLEFDGCSHNASMPLDPLQVGGDTFDLEDLGLEKIRYVRIADLSTDGLAKTAGFDLDAVGAIHFELDDVE
jgi:hypothetical protein